MIIITYYFIIHALYIYPQYTARVAGRRQRKRTRESSAGDRRALFTNESEKVGRRKLQRPLNATDVMRVVWHMMNIPTSYTGWFTEIVPRPRDDTNYYCYFKIGFYRIEIVNSGYFNLIFVTICIHLNRTTYPTSGSRVIWIYTLLRIIFYTALKYRIGTIPKIVLKLYYKLHYVSIILNLVPNHLLGRYCLQVIRYR